MDKTAPLNGDAHRRSIPKTYIVEEWVEYYGLVKDKSKFVEQLQNEYDFSTEEAGKEFATCERKYLTEERKKKLKEEQEEKKRQREEEQEEKKRKVKADTLACTLPQLANYEKRIVVEYIESHTIDHLLMLLPVEKRSNLESVKEFISTVLGAK